MHDHPGTGCSRRGFSLTELLVVIAILILLMAAVLPTIGPMRRRNNLKTGAVTVAGVLRSARTMAIAQSRASYVYANAALDPNEMHIYQSSEIEPDREEELPTGVEITAFSSEPVIFYPDGSARASCTIVVEDETGARRSVTVAPASGRISLSAESR